MKDLLSLRGVTKAFSPGAEPAVNGLTLTLAPGEILALLGPSCCGKTTTLRLIAGFEVPDAGEVEIRGRLMAGAGTWVPPEERGVGIVFQDYALFPHLTVGENVAFGLHHLGRAGRERRRWGRVRSRHGRRLHHLGRAGREKQVIQILELVGLESLIRRYPHELSGGQQQR